MWLVKGAPNLMQRLSRLPPAPNVTPLDCRKPKSLSWSHANTTFTPQTYIRWCCIDLSNAPRLSGLEPRIGILPRPTARNVIAAVLDLIPANRMGVKHPDGSYKSERHFLDL
jgi:hypothetical protein